MEMPVEKQQNDCEVYVVDMANVRIIGDSILKGTNFNEETKSYSFENYFKDIPECENLSKFGCTVTKGAKCIRNMLEKNSDCKFIFMNFGGNDSDYNWKEISDFPNRKHSPKTTVEVFTSEYVSLVQLIKSKNITPVLMTLCPINEKAYFDHFCKSLECNPESVMVWLKDINRLGENLSRYSEIVLQIADQEQIPVIDIRKTIEKSGDLTRLLYADGIHPNKIGQELYLESVKNFLKV